MHEASVAQTVLEIVDKAAAEYPGRPVLVVRVSIGALAHIDDESLRFAFEVLKEETVASGADLEIDREPLRGRCKDCGDEFDAGSFEIPCPGCGSFSISWAGDRESHVVSIDIDD